MSARFFAVLLTTAGLLVGSAHAETSLKFSLDFIMFGPNSPFVLAQEGGYFKKAGLSVTVDPSSGSGDAVNRVASGAYDLGYADVGTVIEFAAKNPDVAPKVVLFIQDRTPATILFLKSTGIKKPSDLEGHSLASGSSDAGARLFPAFARINHVDVSKIKKQIVDFRLRDSMFAQGRFDAIVAYTNSLLNIEKLGLDRSKVGRLDYADWGLKLYGNAMIASRHIIETNPGAVKAAVRAAAQAWRDAIKNPKLAIDALAKRNNLTDPENDVKVLKFTLDNEVVTPFTKANGIGAMDPKRLDDELKILGEAFKLAKVPSSADIYDSQFVPPPGDRKFAD